MRGLPFATICLSAAALAHPLKLVVPDLSAVGVPPAKAASGLRTGGSPALHRDAALPLKSKRLPLKLMGGASLAVGVASGAAAALLLSQANAAYKRIPQNEGDTPMPVADVDGLVSRGKT